MNDPQRHLLFDRVWRATLDQHDRGKVPLPFEDIFNQFEVTLISGPDFPLSLAESLTRLQREVTAMAPHLEPMPTDRLHVTLFSLHRDKPQSLFDGSTAAARCRDYERLHAVWNRFGPIRIQVEGLNLTPQGIVTVQCFDEVGRMDAFRLAGAAAFPDPQRPASESIHITLARPARKPNHTTHRALIDWIAKRRNMPFLSYAVESPVIRATRDRQGAVLHEAGDRELREFYDEGKA